MNNMKEQFVTYEIALKLKELGFDEECLAMYSFAYDNKTPDLIGCQCYFIDGTEGGLWNDDTDDSTSAVSPTWQQTMDWLREIHHVNIRIDLFKKGWAWNWTNLGGWNKIYPSEQTFYKTYKKCREQAILEAMELIKK